MDARHRHPPRLANRARGSLSASIDRHCDDRTRRTLLAAPDNRRGMRRYVCNSETLDCPPPYPDYDTYVSTRSSSSSSSPFPPSSSPTRSGPRRSDPRHLRHFPGTDHDHQRHCHPLRPHLSNSCNPRMAEPEQPLSRMPCPDPLIGQNMTHIAF